MTRLTKEGRPAHAPRRRRLTELAIRKAKPERKAYLIWDTLQRGLALSVQPTGTKSWKVIYSRAARPRWYSIGSANAIGLAAARELAAECMLAVARGKDPAAEKAAERGRGTFQELHQRYLEEHAKKKNKSWRQGEFLVRRFLLPRWGKLQAGAIGRADVRSALAKIEATPSLSNQVLAAGSAIFSWAVKQDILAANPCAKIERNETSERERVLSDGEIPKFWQAFDSAGLVKSSALKTILLSGQRPGEVAAMRWEHIDGNLWTMPGLPEPKTGWRGTKNKQTHDVTLSAPVRALIAELGDGEEPTTGLVFAGCSRASLTSAMRAICADLKVENTATPHDLRRTFATTAASIEISGESQDRLLNHKPKSKIRANYNRYKYREENRIAWEKVAAKIMTLVDGTPANANVVPIAAAGRGPGHARYKASAGYEQTVQQTLADQAAAMALAPRPPKGGGKR